MLLWALVSPTLIVFAGIWLLDRKDRRAITERGELTAQIDRLCQRIQAPDVAVAAQAALDLDEVPDRQFVGFDNDIEFQADAAGIAYTGQETDWKTVLAALNGGEQS